MENRTRILADLLKRVQKGDRWATEELCRQLERDIRGYFTARFQNQALVDDLCQETYLRLLTSISRVERKMKLKSFVAKVAFFVMQDHFRQKYRKKEAELTRDHSGWPLADNVAETRLPGQVHQGDEDEDILDEIAVEQALRQLPEKTRTILRLKSQGYSYEEIADVVSLSLSGVKMQVKRSMEQLRFMLLGVTFLYLAATTLIRYIHL